MVASDPMGTPIEEPEAQGSAYDVVVIGAGVGGLTAGALLARAGKRVLVLEAEARPGGLARSLRRGPYTFDLADHVIMGCAPESPFGPGVIDAVLRHLGVRDQCEFVRMDDPFYVAAFPDLTLEVPSGREAYLEAHLRLFPREEAGLRRLVELSASVLREIVAFPLQPGPSDLVLSPVRFPTLFRHRNATMGSVIDRALDDPRLRAVYATLWLWEGLPPGRASFVDWGAMMANYVEDGPYYCRGGFQNLADALAAGLTAAGGELLLGARATRILSSGGRVGGVTLESGQRIEAPVVISNVDARDTFERMLGPDLVPGRYLRRLRTMEPGPELVALYAATDLDVRALGVRHDTTIYTEWDHDRTFARALAGDVCMLSVVVASLKDPSLAPAGEHLVILKAAAPTQAAGAPSDEGILSERMLELAELVLPELRQHLTFVDEGGAGPDRRLHPLGPYAGWAVTPQQSGDRRLPRKTPIEGLWLVGQWTQPGFGVWTVVLSGIGVARSVLGAPTRAPALPLQV